VAAGTRLGWRRVSHPYGPAEQFTAGRRAAAAALASAGSPHRNVPREADGRPRFPRAFAGSISHTPRLAVAVVAPGAAAVGVDIEEADITARVAAFVLTERERATLLPPAGGRTPRELFCAKEAAFKALSAAGTPDDLLFWRIRLARAGGRLTAAHRGRAVPVWTGSLAGLSFAVAIRR
jgi:4'-phosphopantetheinyl transferase EntD